MPLGIYTRKIFRSYNVGTDNAWLYKNLKRNTKSRSGNMTWWVAAGLPIYMKAWTISRQPCGPHGTERVRAWERLCPRLLAPCGFLTCQGLLAATANKWRSWERPWEAVLNQHLKLNHILVMLNKACEQNWSLSLNSLFSTDPAWYLGNTSSSLCCSICLKVLASLTCPFYLNPSFPLFSQ